MCTFRLLVSYIGDVANIPENDSPHGVHRGICGKSVTVFPAIDSSKYTLFSLKVCIREYCSPLIGHSEHFGWTLSKVQVVYMDMTSPARLIISLILLLLTSPHIVEKLAHISKITNTMQIRDQRPPENHGTVVPRSAMHISGCAMWRAACLVGGGA